MDKIINLYRVLEKNNFIRFCVVGSLGVITNLLIFYVTRNYAGANINISAIIAFCVAVTQNYYLNHFWSFKSITNSKPNLSDYAKYILINIVGLCANLLILNTIIHLYPNIVEVIAQCLSIFSALIVNYTGSYVFVFAKSSPFSEKIKKYFSNQKIILVVQTIKNEYRIIIGVLIISFCIIFIGQMISVIGSRQIIEPITILAQDLNGKTPLTFKRFIQLARAENYTLITESKGDNNNPWKVSGIFAKKILIGISSSDFEKLKMVEVTIGDKNFNYSTTLLKKNWKEFDIATLIPYLNDQDINSYLVFEAPAELSLVRSKIPVYRSFFGSLINWGGDNRIFLNQIKNTLINTLTLLLMLIILRSMFILIKPLESHGAQGVETFHHKKRDIVITFSILTSIVSITVVCWIISIIYKPDISLLLKESSIDFVGNFFKSFRPKPVERLQFLISTVLSPFIVWFFYFWFNSKISETSRLLRRWYPFVITISLSLIFAIINWGLAMSGFFYVRDSYFLSDIGKYIFNILFFPLALFYIIKTDLSKVLKIVLQSIIIVSMLLIFFMNIINLNDSFSTEDIDPVIYPMAQVVDGKNLLVDVTGLYGLYPFFLAPVFKIFGLSVLKFSIIMALLTIMSLVFLYIFSKNVVKNKFMLLSGFITLIFFTLLATRTSPDYYLQYWPIRFIFPALGLLIVSEYFKNQTKLLYYSSFIIFAIGVLWNFDAGIVVLLSWLIILSFNELTNRVGFKNTALRIIKHTAITILSLVIVITFFAINTYISSGKLPDITLFLQYQKIFLSGYLMIKMLLPPHTWNIIVIIYLFGLLIPIKALYHNKVEYIDKMIFFLAILGVGLFSYYEGQSSDVTIFRISYPAIILSLVFADIILNRIKTRTTQVYSEIAIFSILFYFIVSGPFNMIHNVEKYSNFFALGLKNLSLENSIAFENINFIKDNTFKGEKVLILTPPDQGSYYIESKTVSAVNTASLPDIPFPREMDKLIDFLKKNTNTKIFIRTPLGRYDTYDIRIKNILMSDYKEVRKNTNNLSLYEIK